MLKVWDPVVRFCHWTVAAGVMLNLLILEEGRYAHRMVGLFIMVLVAVRLLWGIVGAPYARFGSFVPSWTALVSYTRDVLRGRDERFIGHNPLGAAMMLALWATLIAMGLTGWFASLGHPVAGSVHGTLAGLLTLLIVGHIGGAVYESVRHRENLIWAMITGRKRP